MNKAFWVWFNTAHRWLGKLLFSEHMPSYRLKGQLTSTLFFYMSVWSNLVIYMVHHRLRCIDSWCYIIGFITVLSILILDKWKWNRIIIILSEMLHLIECLLFYELKQANALRKCIELHVQKRSYFINLLIC